MLQQTPCPPPVVVVSDEPDDAEEKPKPRKRGKKKKTKELTMVTRERVPPRISLLEHISLGNT